jgi:hypothetical protein
MDDPQSLNLYAYVRNNPLTGIDVDGHFGNLEGGLCGGDANNCNVGALANGPGPTGGFTTQQESTKDPQLHHRGDPGTGHISQCDGPCKPPPCGTLCEWLSWRFLKAFLAPANVRAPNNDVPLEYDIFHCPSCVNTWKQSDCVVNKPFKTAADDAKWAAAGAAFVGASSNTGGGAGGMIKGAVDAVSKEATGAVALGGVALHSILATVGAVLNGCSE